MNCLIVGPFDTPYEGGFFHFVIRFGPEYPLQPPRVRFLTTSNGTVRFNPNLYSNGKVCLSILGYVCIFVNLFDNLDNFITFAIINDRNLLYHLAVLFL